MAPFVAAGLKPADAVHLPVCWLGRVSRLQWWRNEVKERTLVCDGLLYVDRFPANTFPHAQAHHAKEANNIPQPSKLSSRATGE